MFLKYIKIRLCFILCYLMPIMCSGVNIKLEGLHDTELYLNIYKKLYNIDTNVKYIDENFKKNLDNVIKTSLRSLGYYSPHINFFFIQRM